ncbi:uncharacterized protein LOC136032101 isoform X2 [Artemia franciscana]|uniref:Uncharacterized protein n=1 Tax=Artemia franciscana TaxID=6661 RepID=A0AA88LCS3_ARTSF|nr:hypothetical protein QYM36_000228 [Artemia franciscana]
MPDFGLNVLSKSAVLLLIVSSAFIIVAFSTDNWLANDGTRKSHFLKIGLWNACFDDFKDIRHHYDRSFTGCRHVLDEEYHFIDDFLRPPFFIAVQTFFTFCFICMLIALGGTAAYVLCFTYDYQVFILQALGWVTLTGGACGFIAVVVFGALGDSRDWMPNYEHNFLSWSFALAVVGTYGMIMTSVLFFVEAKIQRRKIEATESNATFALDHPVKS